MSYSILPKPGTKLGPCKTPCQHIDCAETRRQARALCPVCNKPLGYNTRITADGNGNLIHLSCLEDSL